MVQLLPGIKQESHPVSYSSCRYAEIWWTQEQVQFSKKYLNCRMKCNPDEHAIKYCADWTICCKAKNTKFKRKKKW
ncbi:beta-defensin 43-like [Vulpes lagopus]|uniref:beta-defensin 43-like n=1 Tax=Vulpes lagopus TaxID=494514 RepID=UPI001BC9B156|nr:beta-defensin 43-like [Vulpes lagopus]